MAIRRILKLGDETLRTTSRPVTEVDKRIKVLLDDMKETMYAADGVGLAAPQVGVLRRVVVIDVGDGLIELINPEIIATEGKQIMLNGYTLDELTQILSANGFYRCYQSYIVNLSKVSCIRVDSVTKNYTLQFDGYAGEILLSRDKYGEIVSLLKDKYARISL